MVPPKGSPPMSVEEVPLDDRPGYWPCACVKRDRRTKQLTHIRTNHPTVRKCPKCGCERPTPPFEK
jgi:hypothetical protein